MGNYEDIDVTFEEETYPFNYNPVHALWECLRIVGLPETWLDSASFLAAAITVHNEGLGISLYMRDHQAVLVYIKSLLNHMNGVMFYAPDGKLHIKLIRDDFDPDTLVIVGVDDLLNEPMVERGSWMETVGEIQVQYTQLTAPSEEALE